MWSKLTSIVAVFGVALGLVVASVPAAPVALAATSACSGRTTGWHYDQTMSVGGQTRKYTMFVPSSWTPSKAMAVFYIFHGQNGQASGTIDGLQLDVQANKDGFIVVAPQALGDPSKWNIDQGLDVPTSDAQFALQLAKKVTTEWCANPSRQYAGGYSSGSVMTHYMACMGGFPFVGYEGAGAQVWASWCPSPQPFDFVYFHGTADTIVPFNGNDWIPSVPWSAYAMAASDHCEAQPASKSIGSDVLQYTWSKCASGRRLLYDVIVGGGHIWPGADYIDWLGPQTTTIRANQVMSDFWKLPYAAWSSSSAASSAAASPAAGSGTSSRFEGSRVGRAGSYGS